MNGMVATLSLLIISSIAVSVFFFYRSSRAYSQDETRVSFLAVVFSLWLIAAAMWGPAFYAFRLAGLFDMTIERILFVAVIMTMLAGLFSKTSNVPASRTIEPLLALFCLICLISMTFHGFAASSPKYLSPWHMFINGYLFPFAAFLFAKKYLVTERDLSFVFHALFYLGAYLGIMAFFEFFSLRQYVYPQFINDPKVWLHLDRARGPFLNSALNGFAMIIGFVCGIHLLPFKRGFGRLVHLLLLSVFFPAIFFTLTRSVYLCFLLTLGTLLLAYRTSFPKWKLLSIPLAIVLILSIANVHRLSSSDRRSGGVYQVQEVLIREALLRRSMVMIADNPLFGLGLAQFVPASVAKYRGLVPIPESTAEETQHHQLIGMTVELGLVGVSVYLAIIVTLFRRVYSLYTGLPRAGFMDSNLAILIGICLSVYVLNNFFVDSSFQLFPNAVFLTFGGVADGLYSRLGLMQATNEPRVPGGLSSPHEA